jgi:hypothetical protein
MTVGSYSRSKSEAAFGTRASHYDANFLHKHLPTLLMRVFLTERTTNDEKFPCWLDQLDDKLNDYRAQLDNELEESKSRISMPWFGSKKKQSQQSELNVNWAYSLIWVNRLLSLSLPGLAAYCFNFGMQPPA